MGRLAPAMPTTPGEGMYSLGSFSLSPTSPVIPLASSSSQDVLNDRLLGEGIHTDGCRLGMREGTGSLILCDARPESECLYVFRTREGEKLVRVQGRIYILYRSRLPNDTVYISLESVRECPVQIVGPLVWENTAPLARGLLCGIWRRRGGLRWTVKSNRDVIKELCSWTAMDMNKRYRREECDRQRFGFFGCHSVCYEEGVAGAGMGNGGRAWWVGALKRTRTSAVESKEQASKLCYASQNGTTFPRLSKKTLQVKLTKR
jgi:hypothetical protein